MSSRPRDNNSMATILTYDNTDAQSQWSMVWSTSQVPGMDNAAGGRTSREVGRRRLRVGSLVLGALLTMHCRVAASALTGGFVMFLMFLIVAVMTLANPLRHFEVYLGQWSINGPGRAFRILPLLDGIGIAMCLNAIFRAIIYCVIAAMTATYVLHSISDNKLPFTYCRNFALKTYDPQDKHTKNKSLRASRHSMERYNFENDKIELSTIGLMDRTWRNGVIIEAKAIMTKAADTKVIERCEETYPTPYPVLYSTPAYNFFYVEVVKLRPDLNFMHFNVPLMLLLLIIWIIIWISIIMERLIYTRIIWNNTPMWIIFVPWIWTAVLGINAATNFTLNKTVQSVFRLDSKEIVAVITDAFEIALYIHSASVGTELITGKGLNRYASGHIDPLLNSENVWHSSSVLLLTGLHSGSVALCTLIDTHPQPNPTGAYDMHESTLWILPMYSKCTSIGKYSHFVSTCVFLGLTFSYITVAYVFLKTALHTIFEYRVKLVFVEQAVVGALILSCAALSMIFTTSGGLPLLESVEAIMTGVVTNLICLLELVAMLYVYRSHDFSSDANVAMEDSSCSSRISWQWQIIPLVTLITLCIKIAVLIKVDMPPNMMTLASIPLLCVILALPMRAVHNAYTFLRPGTPNRNI